jgi:hypothetical protein
MIFGGQKIVFLKVILLMSRHHSEGILHELRYLLRDPKDLFFETPHCFVNG